MAKLKTHCIKGHPLTPENLHIRPNGSKCCRVCHKLWARKRRRLGKQLKFPLLVAMRHVLKKNKEEDKHPLQRAYRKMMEDSPKEFMKDYARMEEHIQDAEIKERHLELEAFKEFAEAPVIDKGSDTAVELLDRLIKEYKDANEKKAALKASAKRNPADGRFAGTIESGAGEAVVGEGTEEGTPGKEA